MSREFNAFDRLSETAQKIIHDSEAIARSMDTGINTEHILASLANNPGTISYDVLRELMISPERISFVLHNRNANLKPSYGMSPDITRILKTAFQKAYSYGTASVDTEHLLLAMTLTKDCNAYQVLSELDIDPKILRDQLEQYFEQLRAGEEQGASEHEEGAEGTTPETQLPQYPQELTRGGGQSKAKSAIDYFTTDLTKMAKQNKLDPTIGRDKEMRRMIQILIRRMKNNPVLVGEPGVGKTAIVEGLATRISRGDVPQQLSDKRVLSLDLALLISGTTYRGQFEERVKKLVDEIIKAGNVILFLDEIHTIVGAGAAEGSMDLGTIFKPALARGQLRLIGATTLDEYRRYIEKDPALERRLQRVVVEEPSAEESVRILDGLRQTYEKHHSVTIDADAIAAAVELGKRYINDRFLPDKAIDLIDEAAAATQLESNQLKTSNKLLQLEGDRKKAVDEHKLAAENFDYKKAAEWRVLELRLNNEIEKLKGKLPKRSKPRVITREDIAQIVSMWTGIPVTALNRAEKIRLHDLENALRKHIIGQDEAIQSIAQAIKRSGAGVADPNRPLGSFIFLGPTGVGKTELAKVLAREVYGREEALVKIDMSEFMERHNVSRLVGAPPGYVGYEDAGKLTETIRRQPYSVVLLDEIEKAHPDIFNMLLQIMEDGYLTDAKGRRVNFRNTIIIMTSNIGMAELNRQAAIGFKVGKEADVNARYEEIKSQINDKLKENFRPEFLNRLDRVVVFRPLSSEDVSKIVQIQIDKLSNRLLPEGIQIAVEESAREFLAEKGFDPQFGARHVRRVITEYIEDPLSELLLSGKLNKKSPIRVLRKGAKLTLVK
ncbi:MAG: ATP-dependent Clp protease ATP-binding subunit [Candidatus Berkelbacteria bacterium]|nr:MAG: ATP-dependent Clp protease ATP-binding subunit [Candidatus Berkelbacteria bacterium]QQG51391.1 MAG: ATP-dependent Clp protease ATP-binding subunit [Candidatus Berkelbacteria bacterium]